jgi:hypothetical protein
MLSIISDLTEEQEIIKYFATIAHPPPPTVTTAAHVLLSQYQIIHWKSVRYKPVAWVAVLLFAYSYLQAETVLWAEDIPDLHFAANCLDRSRFLNFLQKDFLCIKLGSLWL